ncbi:MAG TPA: hypothetical protein VFV38_42940 [Ktedonobacteraceae bacterium]|nr:hypothetical protein [Ktedonobacteraceae bacterium]
MIFKTKNVRAFNTSPQKATSALQSHLKYLQYRERNPERERKSDRVFFSAEQDRIDRRVIAKDIMAQTGEIYYHRMMLSPADDEPVTDWKAWTRAVMADLEKRLGKLLNWYAMHHHNTDHPHMHIVLQGTGIDRETGRAATVALNPQDFKFLKERGRAHSEYEQYHFLETTLRKLSERDTITQEPELSSSPRGSRPSEQERAADFDR